MDRSELIKLLGRIQNSATYANQDILTFTGFMTSVEEVRDYVWSKFVSLPKADQDRVVAYARTFRTEEAA